MTDITIYHNPAFGIFPAKVAPLGSQKISFRMIFMAKAKRLRFLSLACVTWLSLLPSEYNVYVSLH